MDKIDYLVLLQGINVGGKNLIKMDALKELFGKMKFTEVKTYIQSGNVLFMDYERDKTKLTIAIEKSLFNEFKNGIKIVLMTFSDIKNIINDIPKDFGKENEKYKYDVLFLIEPLTTDRIMKDIKIMKCDDRIYVGEKAIYVRRNAEKLTGSYITQALKISPNITVRNLNTTKKLYELMLERKENIT
jgi:uncharacterized protein (DUF1697 family)